MKKTQQPESQAPAAAKKIQDVVAAFKAAGYKAVRVLPKTIKVEKPGGKRDAAGNREVESIQVHDLALAPGLLVIERNWPAIRVAKDLELAFREFQNGGDELFLRDVRALAE